jgi:hypothetical protein
VVSVTPTAPERPGKSDHKRNVRAPSEQPRVAVTILNLVVALRRDGGVVVRHPMTAQVRALPGARKTSHPTGDAQRASRLTIEQQLKLPAK